MEDYFENALFGTPFTSAVIVAAGSSTRMGGEDKQFIRLCGKPILAHSMTAFQNCPVIEEIVVVTKADSVEAVRAMAAEYGIDKLTAVTEGGASRAESVRNGVAAVSCGAEFVAIHDGARPLVTPEDRPLRHGRFSLRRRRACSAGDGYGKIRTQKRLCGVYSCKRKAFCGADAADF